MSQPVANTSLSLPARLALYLGPPATVLLVSAALPKAGLLTPLAFLPTVGLYKAYSKSNSKDPSQHADLEPLIWTYTLSATAGVAAAAIIQALVGYGTATALFGNGDTRDYFVGEVMRASTDGLSPDDIARRAGLAWSWQNTLFNAITSFGAAGLTEEVLKYLSVAYPRSRLGSAEEKTGRRSRASLDYALAFGLGIGLIEAIGGLYSAVKDPQSSLPKITLTVFERLILGASAHMITAALTALRSIRKDQIADSSNSRRTWTDFFSIIGPSMILHGANNFGLFSFSAWNGNIGWIHPTSLEQNVAMFVMYFSALGTAAWLGRREWKKIQELEKKDE